MKGPCVRGIARDEVVERRLDGGGEHAGDAQRERDAERVAEPRRIFDRGVPIVARHANPDRATILQDAPEHRVGIAIGAGPDLVVTERSEIAQQIVDAVGVTRVSAGGEAL